MTRTGWLLLALVVSALPAAAQYQTPVLDGTINSGEYAYSTGNWSLTWDATYLYVAHAGTSQFVFYVDVDPQTCSVAGTNANGNITAVGDGVAGSTGTITPQLPIRADARALTSAAGDSLKIRDGSGGWTNATAGSLNTAVSTDREISIRWDAIPGLTGVPNAFRFLAFEMNDDGSGNAQLTDPLPSVNATGTAASPTLSYFYDVNFTGNPTSYNWPTQRHRLFYVTTSADSGTGSLRDIITQENADSDIRRHVAFNMGDGNTIQLASNLPQMNNSGVIIDGTTQPGFVSTPIVVLRGTDPNDSVTPSMIFNTLAVFDTFRGLVFQNAYYGIYSTDGFTALIDNCYFGTDVTGMSAQPNSYGVHMVDWDNSIVQNSVFSGNSIYGLYTAARGPTFTNNIFGLAADGSTTIAGSHGVRIEGGAAQFGTNGSDGNIFAGITGDAISVNDTSSQTLILEGNKIGVAADGVTARANSGAALNLTNANVMIGHPFNSALANIIANSAGGITVVQNTAGRGVDSSRNSMYGNSSYGISVSGSSVIQPAPTISAASVNGSGQLAVTYSLPYNPATTQSPQEIQLDLYIADPTDTSVPQGKTWRASKQFQQSADITNATWNVGSGFSVGDKIVITASSYGNGTFSIPGDGTSPFTAVFTTTFGADKIFTGPGNFSDPTKWNGGTLPTAGQSLQILGTCTFDVTTQLTYASITLGDGSTAGNLTFSSGTSDILKVTDINSLTAGSSIDATSGGGLSFSGTWNTANMTFTAGNSTVTFSGTGQTMPALTFHSVAITGTVTATSGTPVVAGGAFNVTGSFTPASGTVEFGPTVTITGGGTIQFNNLTIDSGGDTIASSSFSVASQLIVNGNLIPGSAVVISGAGSLSGSGIVFVTASSFAAQYTLATNLSSLEVDFTGSSGQTIGAGTYGSLRLANSSGASLSGAVTTTNLYLDNGVLTTSSNALWATGTVTATSGWINGKLTRTVSGTGTFTYPVGTSSFSMPVSATLSALTGGTLSFGATAGEQPQIAGSGISTSKDVNAYWTATPGTVVTGPMSLTFTFGANVDASASPTLFRLRYLRLSTWYEWSPYTPTSTTITATQFPIDAQIDFVAGNNTTDHYQVSASSPQSANTAFSTSVTAIDALGFPVTSDNTTVVTMTSNSNHVKFDSNGDGHFTDNTKTLSSGGFTIFTKDNVNETITITASDGTHTGTSSSIVVLGPASATTSTIVASPTSITADGTSTSSITVQAKDSNGNNLVTGGDTVTLSTNRGSIGAVTDNHNGTYSATLTSSTSAGTATVSGTMNGTAMTNTATVTFTPGSATTLVVSAPSTASTGTTISVTVTARDAHANTATGYTGTVHFTSSDSAATLPSNYTFTGGDAGVHTFSVTFNTGGNQSVTATDTVTASITGSASSLVSTPFGPPQVFSATAASTSQVNLSWAPVTGATSYEIFRSTGHSAYASYATTSSTSYPDSGVVANTTYVYEVRAIGGAGTTGFSALDAATTIVFTDPTLSSVVNIKTTHINELRTAVNAMRAAGGLGAATFTDTLTSSTPIKAVHITELRSALDAARSAIGLTALSYTDPTITVGVTTAKVAHVTELRAGTQ